MLQREGIPCTAEARDTLGLLRLLDQDRRANKEAAGRIDLAHPQRPTPLNYRLKDVAAHILGIKPFYTPDKNMNWWPTKSTPPTSPTI